jgi:hypothetical protein
MLYMELVALRDFFGMALPFVFQEESLQNNQVEGVKMMGSLRKNQEPR